MNENEFFNLVTSTIANKITDIGYPITQVKYPNTDIDLTNVNEHVEILINQYVGKKINLKNNKRIYGCVTIKTFTDRSIGSKRATELAIQISECLSGKIIQKVVFDEYDLKILDHTLSQTQTTTSINDFQVNCNIDYSYTR